MESTISKVLSNIRLGEPVCDGGLTLIPIFGEFSDAPKLITLTEALGTGTLVVTEVDSGGSVPELRARNDGSAGVLILDGEELAGAKQNRVLNTSVFLKSETEIVIPVSCTERGRWGYVSERFSDSGHVAAQKVRRTAHESVTTSVRADGGFKSNQGQVWAEVDKLQSRHKVVSQTAAMRDVYVQREQHLRSRQVEFSVQEGQIGVFALLGGKVTGFDVVATPTVYSHLHDRLVSSYALDALVDSDGAGADDLRTAKEFIVSLGSARSTVHESPGDGMSHRFTGPGFVGSTLVADDVPLHAVFFGVDSATERPLPPQRYPSARDRRARWGE